MKGFSFKLFVLAAYVMTSVVQGEVRESFVNMYSNRVFFSYEKIVHYMERLQFKFRGYTKRVPFGEKTADGQQMYYQLLQKSFGLYRFPNPYIVVLAALNGNDWVSTGAVMAFIEKFLGRRIALDDEARNMLDNYDWIIIPVANPDGYKYSRDDYWNRKWVQNTRQVPGVNCHGVNLNKNFMFLTETADSSCSLSYSGPDHFSEVESRAIRDLVKSLGHWFLGFVSVHDKGMTVLGAPIFGDTYQLRWSVPRGKVYHQLKESDRVGPLIAEAMSKAAGGETKYGDMFKDGDIMGTAVDYFQYTNPGTYTYQMHLGPKTPDYYRKQSSSIPEAGKKLYAGLSALIDNMDEDHVNALTRLASRRRGRK